MAASSNRWLAGVVGLLLVSGLATGVEVYHSCGELDVSSTEQYLVAGFPKGGTTIPGPNGEEFGVNICEPQDAFTCGRDRGGYACLSYREGTATHYMTIGRGEVTITAGVLADDGELQFNEVQYFSGDTCINETIPTSYSMRLYCGVNETISYAFVKYEACNYYFSATGKEFCNQYVPTPSSSDVHVGGILIFLALAFTFVYVLVGTAYNYLVKKKPLGTEALPNHDSWQMCCGNVRDGCFFAASCGKNRPRHAGLPAFRESTVPVKSDYGALL